MVQFVAKTSGRKVRGEIKPVKLVDRSRHDDTPWPSWEEVWPRQDSSTRSATPVPSAGVRRKSAKSTTSVDHSLRRWRKARRRYESTTYRSFRKYNSTR